jgi:hypothetical protein
MLITLVLHIEVHNEQHPVSQAVGEAPSLVSSGDIQLTGLVDFAYALGDRVLAPPGTDSSLRLPNAGLAPVYGPLGDEGGNAHVGTALTVMPNAHKVGYHHHHHHHHHRGIGSSDGGAGAGVWSAGGGGGGTPTSAPLSHSCPTCTRSGSVIINVIIIIIIIITIITIITIIITIIVII